MSQIVTHRDKWDKSLCLVLAIGDFLDGGLVLKEQGLVLELRNGDWAVFRSCYDRFSSPVGTENRGGSEVEEILTAAHREFGGCAHCCAGKLKRRDQDRASPRRRGHARSGTAEG